MKLLLDENLPHKLRAEIAGHEVFTVAYLGWSGIGNGELLARAAAAGFDALITNDRGLEYEVNQTTLPLAVIVLMASSNTIEAIRSLYPALSGALNTIVPRTLVKVGA
jgi:hypothetical protein